MLATFAQLERDFISQRTTEALAIKREQGVKMGRARTVSTEVAERIRVERDNGRSWQAIADMLNSEGVRGGQGGKWWPMTCKRVAEDQKRETVSIHGVLCGPPGRSAREAGIRTH